MDTETNYQAKANEWVVSRTNDAISSIGRPGQLIGGVRSDTVRDKPLNQQKESPESQFFKTVSEVRQAGLLQQVQFAVGVADEVVSLQGKTYKVLTGEESASESDTTAQEQSLQGGIAYLVTRLNWIMLRERDILAALDKQPDGTR